MRWTLLILLLISLALATPERLARESWRRLLTAMALSLLVVVLPLFVYFASSFLVYNLSWKGACRFGWVDSFILTKLTLAPFVLAATYALYRLEVLRDNSVNQRWQVLAIFIGAVLAVIFFVFGVVCFPLYPWLLIPLYVAIWYVVRARQLIRQSTLEISNYLFAVLATALSWLAAWFWSKSIYESLPETPPSGCFVVNAAGRGHQNVVGPFYDVEHRGQSRRANQQLITLWQFENLGRKKFPRSHHIFRRGYNRLGPWLAAQIRSPWRADAAFIALKPAEWFARFCLNQKCRQRADAR